MNVFFAYKKCIHKMHTLCVYILYINFVNTYNIIEEKELTICMIL